MEKFEPIEEEFYSIIKKLIIEQINIKFKKDKMENDCYEYIVELQDKVSRVVMTEEEVNKAFRLAVEMLEELKYINNNCVNNKKLIEIENEVNKTIDSQHKAMKTLAVWNRISTPKLELLVKEIDELRLVGGAYAMLVSNPLLISALISVYKLLVDHFDDDNIYFNSAYFLTRAIMIMSGDDILEDI